MERVLLRTSLGVHLPGRLVVHVPRSQDIARYSFWHIEDYTSRSTSHRGDTSGRPSRRDLLSVDQKTSTIRRIQGAIGERVRYQEKSETVRLSKRSSDPMHEVD